jgi:hypothetical protein
VLIVPEALAKNRVMARERSTQQHASEWRQMSGLTRRVLYVGSPCQGKSNAKSLTFVYFFKYHAKSLKKLFLF